MKEIKFKLDNIYKVYNEIIKDSNLLLLEQTMKLSIGVTKFIDYDSKVTNHLDKSILNKVITNELIRTLIIKESTISTSTIEGEIIDDETYENATLDINSIEKERRQQYASALSLNDILDRYVFPNEMTSDDLRYLHNKLFTGPKYNPGKFKASENFVILNNNEKLMYTSPSEVEIELVKLFDFINDKETDQHPITKASLIHMYLALIHPFSDGNGRVIRILLNKYLSKAFEKDIYLDKYILENIDLYKENLNAFRSDDVNEKYKFIIFIANIMTKYFVDYNKLLFESLDKYETTFSLLKDNENIPKTKLDDLTLFIIKNSRYTISSMEHDLKITRATANKYSKIFYDLKIYDLDTHGKKNLFIRKK